MTFLMVLMLATLLPLPIVVGALALEERRDDRRRFSPLRQSTRSQPGSNY